MSAGTGVDLEAVEAFAERVGGVLTGGATCAAMVLGDRLGLYEALASDGPLDPGRLAAAAGVSPRYVREWLSQQACAGLVTYDVGSGTFDLPVEHAAVLATDDSPASLIGAAPLITGMHRILDKLVDAFRTGEGIGWGDQDPVVFESTERFFSVVYRTSLLTEWIPGSPGLVEILRRGARVADVGCGRGAPLVLLAEAYPASTFVGYDSHHPSVEVARRRALDAGVEDRVRFEVADARAYPADGYDLIAFFDAFHDLGDPVGAARHARRALAADGRLMLVEPMAADDLASAIATRPTAALDFAASTFLCTPSSLSQPVGRALGAQAGEAVLRGVLTDAGFAEVHRIAATPFNLVLEARRGH